MEGTKTPARRTRRTVSTAAAPAAPRKAVARPKTAKVPAGARTDVVTSLSPAERLRMIELAAYFRAERRGFAPGSDFEDWLAAEAEVDALLPSAPAKSSAKTPAKAPAKRTRKAPAN